MKCLVYTVTVGQSLGFWLGLGRGTPLAFQLFPNLAAAHVLRDQYSTYCNEDGAIDSSQHIFHHMRTPKGTC